MENDQFKELIGNFYKSNEQLEKALTVMGEYSQKQKKFESVSADLINALSQSNISEVTGVFEALNSYITSSKSQMDSIQETLEDMASEIGDIRNRIDHIDVSAGLLHKDTGEGLEEIGSRLEAIEDNLGIAQFE